MKYPITALFCGVEKTATKYLLFLSLHKNMEKRSTLSSVGRSNTGSSVGMWPAWILTINVLYQFRRDIQHVASTSGRARNILESEQGFHLHQKTDKVIC